MTPLAPLPEIIFEPLVRSALLEDLGRAGDVTTDAIAPAGLAITAALVSRQAGVIAGLDLVRLAFALMDPNIAFAVDRPDGAAVGAGETIARASGSARGILGAERVALNFVSRLSGVASATAAIVASLAGAKARVVCTRKTTPTFRAIEKYAVRAGGGANHRFGLDDAVLIKDNHVAIAGGIAPAIRRAKAHVGHLVKIEVEVDTLAQLDEALAEGVDAVLLDNMDVAAIRRAVERIAGRAIAEASGRVTPQSAPAIAATGVDLISVGWLTHSAPILDIGLDFAG
jgi:nicotinate-nucleotide pyrophosphorylase (carboxylating)